jgi:hypothetical protein
MPSLLQRALNEAVIFFCRPYIKRELLRWGRPYKAAAEDDKPDRWAFIHGDGSQ